MNKVSLFAAAIALSCASLTASAAPLRQTDAPDERIALSDVTSGRFSPDYVYGVQSVEGEDSYTQIVDGRRIVRHSFKDGAEIGVLVDLDNVRGEKRPNRIEGYVMSPDGTRVLIASNRKAIYRRSFTADYYLYDIKNNKIEPLSDGGPQQAPIFSPDGQMIAFARGGNLFIVKLLFGNAETQVTKDGEVGKILNGIPDWVNEEEFSTARSFDFSADSKMLAWVRYDETAVPVYRIPMYKGQKPALTENEEYPGEFSYKYPVAGARNSSVAVLTFDIKNRVTRTLDLPLDEDGYVPRIKFTSDAEKLAVVTLNRHQNRMDVYMANPRSTVCRLALREESDKYIKEDAYTAMKFYDGHFSLISERNGHSQLYWYTLDGVQERKVSADGEEVTAFYGFDAASGRFFYAATDGSPLRRAVFAADKNGRVRKISTEAGTNAATFSASMKYFMNVYSSTAEPPVTTLRTADGKTLKTLIDNAELKTSVAPLRGQQEFFTFTTSEGVELNGWMMKPRNFDASKQYPVIMYQYSGPGSQEVHDAWGIGFYGGAMLESYAAQEGYIYVIVDGRGTGYRGTDFEKCTYLRLGDLESKDQAEAALYLGTLPYVDKTRIGIWGWSFGGFNTLMSLTDPRHPFKTGVAIAAPSSWKFYDTVYTERYMRTPKENAEGYAISPLERAAQLEGNLLLIHGTADDNVHFRNATEMSEALVQADKQFDMQVYTNRNHFIRGGNSRLHLFKRVFNFLKANL